jgi:hypothetical protein
MNRPSAPALRLLTACAVLGAALVSGLLVSPVDSAAARVDPSKPL